MNALSNLEKLTIHPASQDDWKEILKLMEETGRTFYFSGKESYEKFYVVKDPDTQNILCAFELEIKAPVAVLKYLGVKKSLQGKGIGKYVVNKVPELLKNKAVRRLYASTWESHSFWEKTDYKEIRIKDVKDEFFKAYLSELEKGYPEKFHNLLKNYLVEID